MRAAIRLLSLVLATAGAGCVASPAVTLDRPSPSFHALSERWSRALADSSLPAVVRAERLRALLRTQGALLSFWTRDSLPDDLRDSLRRWEHPCGESVTAFVRRIPPRHAVIEGETVFELSRTGDLLRQWPVPIDRIPLGLNGDTLLLNAYSDSVALGISPAGALSIHVHSDTGAREAIPCPESELLSTSAYKVCTALGATEPKRILVYQGPCM